MNLTTDPWIPVIDRHQSRKRLSLLELFEQAHTLRDLSINPIQRVALMRLLNCIVQRSLEGPEDTADWLECRSRIQPATLTYMNRWQSAFELYGKNAFLQISELQPVNQSDLDRLHVDKLSHELASGTSSHTLFDREALSGIRVHPASDVALMLLTFQCFALGGGQSSKLKWNNMLIDGSANGNKNNNYTAAPCAGSKLFTILRGESLLETLHLNLITKKQVQQMMPGSCFGKPIWEDFPKAYNDNRSVAMRKEYLANLVPLSRFIKLSSKRPDRINLLTNGYAYSADPLLYRDPMQTIVVNETNDGETISYLTSSPGKHVWRDLYSILALNEYAALPLANLPFAGKSLIDIWIGGLQSNQASPIEYVEWCVSIEPCVLGESNWKKYETGVKHLANRANVLLDQAIAEFHTQLGTAEFQKKENGRYGRRDKRANEFRKRIQYLASCDYWSILDENWNILLNAAVTPKVFLNDQWYAIVKNAAREAYYAACPHTTPRQIQAFTLGKQKLKLKKLDE